MTANNSSTIPPTVTAADGTVYNIYEIPTQPENQTFSISLNGTTYNLRLKWNAPNASWVLDILDSQQNGILRGVPLITGADLLAQYAYMGIGGKLIVQSDNNPDQVPDYTTLGSTGHLYFLSSQLSQ